MAGPRVEWRGMQEECVGSSRHKGWEKGREGLMMYLERLAFLKGELGRLGALAREVP
jgi:hypothetical protein